jgi:hypothetical protein
VSNAIRRDLLSALSAYSLFSFLLHFTWEMLQVPFFAQLPAMAHWHAILVCLQATIGDVAIALVAFGAGAWLGGQVRWFLKPSGKALAAYVSTGLVATFFLERHALAAGRWSYSELMPVIPILGVGLVPLLQWALLPPLYLYLARRLLGANA